jgi:hypothetical protein
MPLIGRKVLDEVLRLKQLVASTFSQLDHLFVLFRQ